MNSPAAINPTTKPKSRKTAHGSRLRWAVFQAHWLFGITIGIVLGVMGVTGATMAFENQVMEALSPGVVDVAPRQIPVLTPDALLARFVSEMPGTKPTTITLRTRAGAAPQITFTPPRAGDGPARAEKLYVDPYDGRILGHATGEQFFATVRRLHRFLLLPGDAKGPGRQITGITALSLLGFLASGIYLRWPKRPLNWRLWFKPNLRARKRGLYFSLHQVIGTWVLPVYLIIALTGLTYSYPWFKSGFDWLLTGQTDDNVDKETAPKEAAVKAPSGAKKAKAAEPLPTLDPTWRTVLAEPGGASTVIISIPKIAREHVRVRYLSPDAGNDRAYNELKVRPDGAIIKRDLYSSHSLGGRISTARLAVHRGSFFGLPFAILFMLSALAMPLFPITGYLLYLGRRRMAPSAARRSSTRIE